VTRGVRERAEGDRDGDCMLSVISVTWNNLDGVRATWESLKGQPATDSFEWIVVDGASTDGTPEELERIAEQPGAVRFRHLSEPDEGLYHAMNKGIGLARGRYALFLNAGDAFDGPDTVAQLLPLLRAAGGEAPAPVLYGDFVMLFAGGRTLHRQARPPEYIHHSLPTSHQAILYPLDFLQQNPYDLRFGMSGDYYITASAVAGGRALRRIPVTVARFEIGGTSLQNPRRVLGDMARIQARVLGMSRLRIARSAAKRLVNMTGVRLIQAGRLRPEWFRRSHGGDGQEAGR
jgi:putative colanic acid biosynthesis glycosyltransferase